MGKFILLATQQSCAGFFTSLLNSHPEIHVLPELLLYPEFKNKNNYFWRKQIKQSAVSIMPPGKIRVLIDFFKTAFNKKKNYRIVGINNEYDQLAIIPDQLHLLNRNFNTVIQIKVQTDLVKTNSGNLQYSESKLFLKQKGWEFLFHTPIVPPVSNHSATERYEVITSDLQNNNLKQMMDRPKPLYGKNPMDHKIVKLFINALFRLDMKTQTAKVYDIFQKRVTKDNDVSTGYNFLMNNKAICY